MLRVLTRSPRFIAAAGIVLASGIAAASGALGILDTHLIRSPRGITAAPLRRLYFASPMFTAPHELTSYPVFQDLKKAAVFSSVAASFARELPVDEGASGWRAPANLVSDNYFETLGVNFARGRSWTPAEGAFPAGSAVAVISFALWQGRFNSDPAILGRSIQIGGNPFRIIGVLSSFRGVDVTPVDLWLPLSTLSRFHAGRGWERARGNSNLMLLAVPRSDMREDVIASRASNVLQRADAESGESTLKRSVLIAPIQAARGPIPNRTSAVMLWIAAVAVLLAILSTWSTTSMIVVRSMGRRLEFSIRLAIGGTFADLRRIVLWETAAVGVTAMLLAVPFTFAFVVVGERLLATGTTPVSVPSAVRLLPICLAIAVLTATGAAFAAVRTIDVPDLRLALAAHASRSGRECGGRVKQGFVIGQIAMSVCLGAGALAFAASLYRAQAIDLGLDPKTILVEIPFRDTGIRGDQINREYERLLQHVRQLPQVRGASISAGIPFRFATLSEPVTAGRPAKEIWQEESARSYQISPGYFSSLSMALVEGRPFSENDVEQSLPVAIVNQALAQRLWPGDRAIGKCLYATESSKKCMSVVGVVRNTAVEHLTVNSQPQLFAPLAQEPGTVTGLLVQVRDSYGASALRDDLIRANPRLPRFDIRSIADVIEPQMRPWRAGASIGMIFVAIALLIVIASVYSLVSQAVEEQRHDIGIRMALGATPANIARRLLGEVAIFGCIGVAAGCALAAAPWSLVEPLLMTDSMSTAAILALTAVTMTIILLTAVAGPIFRATYTDPATSLRAS